MNRRVKRDRISTIDIFLITNKSSFEIFLLSSDYVVGKMRLHLQLEYCSASVGYFKSRVKPGIGWCAKLSSPNNAKEPLSWNVPFGVRTHSNEFLLFLLVVPLSLKYYQLEIKTIDKSGTLHNCEVPTLLSELFSQRIIKRFGCRKPQTKCKHCPIWRNIGCSSLAVCSALLFAYSV